MDDTAKPAGAIHKAAEAEHLRAEIRRFAHGLRDWVVATCLLELIGDDPQSIGRGPAE